MFGARKPDIKPLEPKFHKPYVPPVSEPDKNQNTSTPAQSLNDNKSKPAEIKKTIEKPNEFKIEDKSSTVSAAAVASEETGKYSPDELLKAILQD